LTNLKFESYSNGEDGFIATDYYISPDMSKIGLVGCVWGGPYYMKIFKIGNPLDLPWTEFEAIELTINLGDTISWLDNETLEFKNGSEKKIVKIGPAHNNV
jgi:hypothetical protein